jgi:CRP-like cAMP-binding protein
LSELQHYIGAYFGLTNNEADQVASLFKLERLPKGGYFLKKEQYCERLSFMKSGYIRIFAHQDDKEITQWISGKGSFITELSSFLFSKRARFHMQAITDCEFYSISSENYRQLTKLVSDWPKIERQFMAACFISLEDRVFQHLSLSAEARYQKLFDQDRVLFQSVPLQYIASMLGMSPETFSRIRAKLTS